MKNNRQVKKVAESSARFTRQVTKEAEVDAKGRTLYLPSNPKLQKRVAALTAKYKVPGSVGRINTQVVKQLIMKLDPTMDVHSLGNVPGDELVTLLARLQLWAAEAKTGTVTEAASEKDMDHNKTIIAKGVKGMKSTPFSKKFKNMAAFDKWSDSDAADDFSVQQVMNEGKKSKRKVNEGVLDDMDDDGVMAKRQLYDIAKQSVALHRIIQDTDNLEAWVQAKLTRAADYISTVLSHLEYDNFADAAATSDVMGADDMADMGAITVEPEDVNYATTEDLMAEGGDGDDSYDAWSILDMALARGVIAQWEYDDPTEQLIAFAQSLADEIAPGDIAGTSDVSTLMRHFVSTAEEQQIVLAGPKVDRYYNLSEAHRRYAEMMSGLKGKK